MNKTPRTTAPEQKNRNEMTRAELLADSGGVIKTVAEHHRDRYAELLNHIITASGVAKPTDVSDTLQGPDLCAVGIDALWLIEKQRQTLEDARKVIEMFMPNVARCFGIDVGALNRTMVNIAMVQRGTKPEDAQ